MPQNQKGFSLIELLMVVTIIGIIASIAVPNLMASRRTANEASAIQSIRTISSTEASYEKTVGNGAYGSLAALQAQNLIDSSLGSGTKSGYNFTVNTIAGPPAQYWAYALPTITSGVGQTGARRFGITEDGVLRANTTLSAPASYVAINPGMPPLN